MASTWAQIQLMRVWVSPRDATPGRAKPSGACAALYMSPSFRRSADWPKQGMEPFHSANGVSSGLVGTRNAGRQPAASQELAGH